MPAPSLSPDSIARLLQPYVGSAAVPPAIYDQLALYLELILKWNARINLTAVRNPEEIVSRHFGESLFAGLHLDSGRTDSGPQPLCDSLLDLGSGAGFPGIPMQLLWPNLPITLAESRTRKAAFLHEAVRSLELGTEVWAGRAEALPADRRFHTVALRAVDEMDSAVAEAARRAQHRVLIMGTCEAHYPTLPTDFQFALPVPIPGSEAAALWIADRQP